MSICPGCQIGTLESFSGKIICNNTRCHYTETCSDGGCMVGSEIVETHPFQTCPKCDRVINTLAIKHHCIDPNAARLDNEPSSTAASDYAKNEASQFINVTEIFKQENLSGIMPGNLNVQPTYHKWEKDTLRRTIYLSGPMTGYPDMNKAVFDSYAASYRDMGWDVINPAENIDLSIPYEEHMRRDIRALTTKGVDGVYLLPNWQKSKGAGLEVHLARVFNIPLFDAQTGEPFKETIVQEAYRLVHGDRRDTYKNPLDDFGRTAGILNALFQHKLSPIEHFTAQDVALMMIAVKLSRLTNKPDHRDSCVDIAGYAECYWWCGELLEEMRSMPS